MKKKFDLKKLILNYIIFGIIPYFSVTLYFSSWKDLKINYYDFFNCFIVMLLYYPFKSLFFEYREIWKTAKLDRKIFIILGIIFVVYGVYYRAKISGSFK